MGSDKIGWSSWLLGTVQMNVVPVLLPNNNLSCMGDGRESFTGCGDLGLWSQKTKDSLQWMVLAMDSVAVWFRSDMHLNKSSYRQWNWQNGWSWLNLSKCKWLQSTFPPMATYILDCSKIDITRYLQWGPPKLMKCDAELYLSGDMNNCGAHPKGLFFSFYKRKKKWRKRIDINSSNSSC